mmetsp:Transcript_25765/g.41292  ORF Transcript_25765/g.41292 Transcript_25765/m.41292 type:complete len:301 (-) Transcript_25765:100-1002(-)
MCPRNSLVTDGKVCKLSLLVRAIQELSTTKARLLLFSGRANRSLETTKKLCRISRQLGMVDGTSRGNHNPVRPVVLLDILSKLISSNGLDVLDWAKDGVTQRTVVECCQVQAVKDDLLYGLLDLLHFTQDDATLEVQMRLIQGGVLEDVSQDVNTLLEIIFEALGIVDRLLSRCVRIQVSTHVLDFLLQLDSVSPLGPLEGHVFQKVSRAVALLRLEAAAGIDPNSHRDCLIGGVLRCDAQAIIQFGDLGRWLLICCRPSSLQGTRRCSGSIGLRRQPGNAPGSTAQQLFRRPDHLSLAT